MTLRVIAAISIAICSFAAVTQDPPGCVTHPCTTTVRCAIDTASGSEITEVRNAVNSGWRGDTIKLEAGCTFNFGSTPLTFSSVSGTSGYLTLTSIEDSRLPQDGTRVTPAYMGVMPWLTSSGGTTVFIVGGSSQRADHVKLRGLWLRGAGPVVRIGTQGTFNAQTPTTNNHQPDDAVIQHCIFTHRNNWLSGTGGNSQSQFIHSHPRTIAVIRDSWLAGAMALSGEKQAIWLNNSTGLTIVENNYIANVDGENIMAGGTGTSIGPVGPSAMIVNNSFINHPERQRFYVWRPSTYVFKGNIWRDSVPAPDNRTYEAQNSGLTSSSEPSWPTTINGLVVDGGITWRLVHTDNGKHIVKNQLEFKNARDVTVRYNSFRYHFVNADQDQLFDNKLANCGNNSGSPCQCVPYFSGRVNTSSATVSWVSGDYLPVNRVPRDKYNQPGNAIIINGTTYTVSSYTSSTQLTLTGSAGTQSNVTYKYGDEHLVNEVTGPPCVPSWNRNIVFEHNVLSDATHAVNFIQMDNAIDSFTGGFTLRNNLIYDMDRDTWGKIGTDDGNPGILWWTYMMPRIRIENNTAVRLISGAYATFFFENNRGGAPLTVIGGDTTFRNNIFHKIAGEGVAGRNGTTAEAAMQYNLCNGSCATDQIGRNIIAGVNLANYDAHGTNYNLCPSAAACTVNMDYSDGGYGKLFEDYAGERWKIRPAHYAQGGGLFGKSIGANWDLLPIIQGLSITPTDDKALFRYRVSGSAREIPCSIEVSTARDMDWANGIADLSPVSYLRPDTDHHDRSFVDGLGRVLIIGKNSPLSASSTYWYRLHCGGALKEGSFTTLAALTSTATINEVFKAPSTDDYALEYGTYTRSTDTFSDTTATTSCSSGAQCSISFTANRGDIYGWRWVRSSDGEVGPVHMKAIQ
ncbi:MAG: hypothetical protein A2Z18_03395 [Armatimonadetes bacterium RBG_16_58_9]|nr:MAG: hypothetical protein A2Z18_03395 [Armatimonadetes bacterium RBG_16_58_9]